jgi:hypothetical protein
MKVVVSHLLSGSQRRGKECEHSLPRVLTASLVIRDDQHSAVVHRRLGNHIDNLLLEPGAIFGLVRRMPKNRGQNMIALGRGRGVDLRTLKALPAQ